MAHLYLNDNATGVAAGESLSVTGSEARHAITVGRLAVGEQIRVGDGKGLIAYGVVTLVSVDRFELLVESTLVNDAPSPAIWLAQALAKGDRDERAIQAVTELGVDGVIPWAASRSIVKWEGTKVRRHEERWASILREASKQSVRSRIPALRPLASTAALVALGKQYRMIVLDPTSSTALSAFVSDGRDVVVIVGPEGGFAPEELTHLTAAGASGMSLGSTILRTGTAGPAALAVLNVALGRW